MCIDKTIKKNNESIWSGRLLLLLLVVFCTAQQSPAITADDIEVIPNIKLDNSEEAYSPCVAVNPVDKAVHVFWCNDGDIYHKYRSQAGSWSSREEIPDGGYNVSSVDEDEDDPELYKRLRNIAAEFDQSGNIHLAFAEAGGGLYYMKRTGTSWSAPQLVRKTSILKVNLDITKLGSRIFIAYEEGKNDYLYCVEHNGSSWKTPVLMGRGEHCYLEQSPAGYVYFYSRGYLASDGRNVVFAYLSGDADWTFVTGVTNSPPSPFQVGGGPYMTVANGRLFMGWPLVNSDETADKQRKATLLCASALEPGTSWTPVYPAPTDTLFFGNTADVFPRLETYSDGTPLLLTSRRSTSKDATGARFVLWTGTQWTEEHNVPWKDTISEVDCDGETIWVVHVDINTSLPNWKHWQGPISITGLKNTNPVPVKPNPPALQSATVVNTTQIKLSFTAVNGASSYNVYRGTTVNFTPDKVTGLNRVAAQIADQDAGTAGVQWTDTASGAGNAAVNHFYAVTAVGSIESDPSNILGEFDFSLVTTATTDFNEIALPLLITGVNNASELMDLVPFCNSVARWDAVKQGYEQYVPEFPDFLNFAIEDGHPYYVNVTTPAVFTMTGAAATPTFALTTTAKTSFNDIMLPLHKNTISMASALRNDIQVCNGVAFWDASVQGYVQYVVQGNLNDFSTRAGYPYYVSVTANSSWPSEGLLKLSASGSTMSTAVLPCSAPHAVYGKLAGDIRAAGFSAGIEGSSGDRLNETSPGCRLGETMYVVQTGSFKQGWRIGDTIKIEFFDKEGAVIGTAQTVLTSNAYDRAEDTELSVNSTPQDFQLMQNFPNPFNPETLIRYSIPKNARVQLDVFNPVGQHIRTLVNEDKPSGAYKVLWDGRNDAGMNVTSGTYFYVLKCGDLEKRMKAVLVR